MDDSWDGARAPYVLQLPDEMRPWERVPMSNDAFTIDNSTAKARFREFFRNFRDGNVYIYRESLLRHWNQRDYFIEIDLDHVGQYDEVLLSNLQVLVLRCIRFPC